MSRSEDKSAFSFSFFSSSLNACFSSSGTAGVVFPARTTVYPFGSFRRGLSLAILFPETNNDGSESPIQIAITAASPHAHARYGANGNGMIFPSFFAGVAVDVSTRP